MLAAGAVAPYCDAPRVGAELDSMRRRPSRRVQAIVGSGRKFVLGRQSVIDRSNDAAGAGTQISAHPIMGIEAAQYEATAVKEHQQRKGTSTVWRVDAEAQRLLRPVNRLLANSGDVRWACH